MSEGEELDYSSAIKQAYRSLTRFPLVSVRGTPLMCCIADNWEDIWAFNPHPSDLLIATYPKAGDLSEFIASTKLLLAVVSKVTSIGVYRSIRSQ